MKDSDYTAYLKKFFGKDGFLENQLEAVKAADEGRNLFVQLPTGGGKSLCFQLPALISMDKWNSAGKDPKKSPLTIVISPLLALMNDQVGNLNSRLQLQMEEDDISPEEEQESDDLLSFCAGSMNGGQSRPERCDIRRDIIEGRAAILYVSPESLRFRELPFLCRERRIERIVIDEVHCLFEWGLSFRPDYRNIADFIRTIEKKKKKDIPVSCFTATVSAEAKDRIIAYFKQDRDRRFLSIGSGASRDNLSYHLHETDPLADPDESKKKLLWDLIRPNGKGRIRGILKKDRNGKYRIASPVIIYALYTKTTEEIAKFLNEKLCELNGERSGEYVLFFHGKCTQSHKDEVIEKFCGESAGGREYFVAANAAFGMGIDKPNVRAVINYDMPESFESYIQQAGRAGRDRKPAECHILHSVSDYKKHDLLLEHSVISLSEVQRLWQYLRERELDRPEAERGKKHLGIGTGILCSNLGFDPMKVNMILRLLEDKAYIERDLNRFYEEEKAETTAEKTACYVRLKRDFPKVAAGRIPCSVYEDTKLSEDLCLQGLPVFLQDLVITKIMVEKLKKKYGEGCLSGVELAEAMIDREPEVILCRIRSIGKYPNNVSWEQIRRYVIKPDDSQRERFRSFLKLVIDADQKDTSDTRIGYKEDCPDLLKGYLNKEDFSILVPRFSPAASFSRIPRYSEQEREELNRVRELLCERALMYSLEEGGSRLKLFSCRFHPDEDMENMRYSGYLSTDLLDLDMTKAADLYGRVCTLPLGKHVPFDAKEDDLGRRGSLALFEDLGLLTCLEEKPGKRRMRMLIRLRKMRDFREEDFRETAEHYQCCRERKIFLEHFAQLVRDGSPEQIRDAIVAYFSAGSPEEALPAKQDEAAPVLPGPFREEDPEEEKLAVIRDEKHRVISVAAGPGSGKTSLLIRKTAALLKSGRYSPDDFVMLTFTNKANENLKERLETEAGIDTGGMIVSTFHAYACRLTGRRFLPDEGGDAILFEAAEKLSPQNRESADERLWRRKILILDEAQDLTEGKMKLVRALFEAGNMDQLISVMDDDQQIFAYMGAGSKYIKDFVKSFPKRETAKYELTSDFRSTETLVRYAERFRNANIRDKERSRAMVSRRTEQGSGVQVFRCAPEDCNSVICDEVSAEARRILKEGRKAVLGVLRVRADDVREIYTELKKRFGGRKGVQLRMFVGGNREEDDFYLVWLDEADAILRRFEKEAQKADGWVNDPDRLIADFERAYQSSIYCRPMLRFVQDYRRRYTDGGRLHYAALYRYMRTVLFSEFFDDYVNEINSDEGLTICVSTVHSAKGREFDSVCMCCPQDERLDNCTEEDYERLRYVAMTRARDGLVIFDPEPELHYPEPDGSETAEAFPECRKKRRSGGQKSAAKGILYGPGDIRLSFFGTKDEKDEAKAVEGRRKLFEAFQFEGKDKSSFSDTPPCLQAGQELGIDGYYITVETEGGKYTLEQLKYSVADSCRAEVGVVRIYPVYNPVHAEGAGSVENYAKGIGAEYWMKKLDPEFEKAPFEFENDRYGRPVIGSLRYRKKLILPRTIPKEEN